MAGNRDGSCKLVASWLQVGCKLVASWLQVCGKEKDGKGACSPASGRGRRKQQGSTDIEKRIGKGKRMENKQKTWSRKTWPVDGEKLRTELRKRGVSLTKADEAVGYGRGYLGSMTIGKSGENNGHRISDSAMKLLKVTYNITYEDIKLDELEPKQEQAEPEKVKPTVAELTPSGINAIINGAVREAIRNEIGDRLEEMIRSAMYGGDELKSIIYAAVNRVYNEPMQLVKKPEARLKRD